MASWPPLLRADTCAAMLNFEIADHPVYDGLELQWFDDAAHGTGMLAFLGRRGSRVVDYYAQRGLRLDPADYLIGAGTGAWVETDITDALLEISDDGVHAAADFTGVDRRRIEVRVDDRDGRRRRRSGLLAPVSASIERPSSLFLVWLPAFDLVRTGGHPPVLRIGDADLEVGRLPGEGLHRRRLIKYAAPLVSIEVLPDPRSDDAADIQPPAPARDGVAEAAVGGGTVRSRRRDPGGWTRIGSAGGDDYRRATGS